LSTQRSRLGRGSRSKNSEQKRRQILAAAVRVFARQGFHACRVSDIADEAGVAYGLVYHYFASKDEILDTLFLERWNVMLELIREVDLELIPVRDKLRAIASFIVDSYEHDPDLMKVIIVEVTRAANSGVISDRNVPSVWARATIDAICRYASLICVRCVRPNVFAARVTSTMITFIRSGSRRYESMMNAAIACSFSRGERSDRSISAIAASIRPQRSRNSVSRISSLEEK